MCSRIQNYTFKTESLHFGNAEASNPEMHDNPNLLHAFKKRSFQGATEGSISPQLRVFKVAHSACLLLFCGNSEQTHFLQQRCVLRLCITARRIGQGFQNNVHIQRKKSWQRWSNGREALALNVRYNHALMCLLELVVLFSGPTPEICLSVLQVSTPSRGEL